MVPPRLICAPGPRGTGSYGEPTVPLCDCGRLGLVVAKLLAVCCLLSFSSIAIAQADGLDAARAAIASNDYEGAMKACESILAVHPDDQAARAGEIEAASKAALALRSNGSMEEALSRLLRAQGFVANDPQLLFEIGVLENQMHLNHDADEALQQSLHLRPDDPLTLYAMARVKMDMGLYPEAETTLRLYLKKRPDDASAHYGLGRILLINLKDEAALEEFQRAIALQPAQTESYFEIGEIERRIGDFDRARENYQTCLTRDPKHGGALTGMGILEFRQKQYEQAANYLDRAVLSAPNYQPAHYYRGLTLAKLGRKEEAETELATATRLAAEENSRKKDGLRLATQ
jgi:tetratricopeptide (TPR) repeat protein